MYAVFRIAFLFIKIEFIVKEARDWKLSIHLQFCSFVVLYFVLFVIMSLINHSI